MKSRARADRGLRRGRRRERLAMAMSPLAAIGVDQLRRWWLDALLATGFLAVAGLSFYILVLSP